MYRTVYVSAAAGQLDADGINDLLRVSRRNNARLGVTGLMLYHDGNFFQILEGPEEVVTRLYDRIAADSRHRYIIRLLSGPITERAFPGWQMGFVPLAELAVDQRDGVLSLIALAKAAAGPIDARAKDPVPEVLIKSFLRGFRDLAARMAG